MIQRETKHKTFFAYPTITDFASIELELNRAKLNHYHKQNIATMVVSKPNEARLQRIIEDPKTFDSQMNNQLAVCLNSYQNLMAEKESEKVKYEAKIKEIQEELKQLKRSPKRRRT